MPFSCQPDKPSTPSCESQSRLQVSPNIQQQDSCRMIKLAILFVLGGQMPSQREAGRSFPDANIARVNL